LLVLTCAQKRFGALLLAAGLAVPLTALAAGDPEAARVAQLFAWIALILVAAKIGALVERVGLPSVLGELVMGIVIGNLSLVGFHAFEGIEEHAVIQFLAQLGVVILLFQIGLESSVAQMARVGARATAVAVIGVVAPFLLGAWVAGPWLLPGQTFNTYLFIGATLTATSVGITGRVFRDMNFLQAPEAQIVLGAAVIDDVLGLVILAVVSALVQTGSMDALATVWIIAKALVFLAGALLLGRWLVPAVTRVFRAIGNDAAMQFTVMIALCLAFAWGAHQFGLATIIGAFAAGLVLEEAHFHGYRPPAREAELEEAIAAEQADARARLKPALEHLREHRLEGLIEPLAYFVVPFFFVSTGMSVKLHLLADPVALGIALALTAVAIAGKLMAGVSAGPVRRWLVGWGMVPRGEVGLVFAAAGMALGVVTERDFAIVVLMVVLTTLVTPPLLAWLIRKSGR
jgi:Kef-type K+ transport system membrane component KefB